ncbi:MAG: ABC transporter ATP-binding protein [Oscillospiraceae bacterium]|nr:ABC transporter ATP-binding protein [Oscillospiraceae bacterium]
MSTVLKAKDIYKTYKAESGETHALNGVSAEFEEGLFYTIIGRSGSGKSTLLHILGGLDEPTSDNIYLGDEDLYSYPDAKMAEFRRRHMGFVFQQFNLLDEYTVLTNICMPMKLDNKKPDPELLQNVTKLLGIADKLKKYPTELSGGEQQRVAIARSVLAKPQLIFADEPTGNLDKKNGETTIQLLRDCAQQFGQTLIMVTHDPEIAAKADVVIKIEDGVVID